MFVDPVSVRELISSPVLKDPLAEMPAPSLDQLESEIVEMKNNLAQKEEAMKQAMAEAESTVDDLSVEAKKKKSVDMLKIIAAQQEEISVLTTIVEMNERKV